MATGWRLVVYRRTTRVCLLISQKPDGIMVKILLHIKKQFSQMLTNNNILLCFYVFITVNGI